MTKSIKDRLKSALCISALGMVSIHVINKIIFLSATRKDCLNTGTGSYYKWRFGSIYYRKQGHGKPLLLIHDLTAASSAYEWNRTVRKLSENHTVYTIDLIGCGRSAKPRLTYTNYMYVQLLTDFTKHVIGQKTDVAVTGFSSSFVIMACNTSPELFDRIVFINPACLSTFGRIPNKRSRFFKNLLEMPIIGTSIYNMYMGRCPLKRSIQNDYFNNKKRCSYKNTDAYYESAHLGSADARYLFASLKGRFVNIPVAHAFKQIHHPVFLINGSNLTKGKASMDDYAVLNPSIKISIIANTKYLPQLEDPAAFVSQIQEYLQ